MPRVHALRTKRSGGATLRPPCAASRGRTRGNDRQEICKKMLHLSDALPSNTPSGGVDTSSQAPGADRPSRARSLYKPCRDGFEQVQASVGAVLERAQHSSGGEVKDAAAGIAPDAGSGMVHSTHPNSGAAGRRRRYEGSRRFEGPIQIPGICQHLQAGCVQATLTKSRRFVQGRSTAATT